MFGIGLGEILLIAFVVFLVAPRDLPELLRKVGRYLKEIEKVKREMLDIKSEIEELIDEARKSSDTIGEHPSIKVGDVELIKKRERD
jgi:Sec-independent protein translocase protein TatA